MAALLGSITYLGTWTAWERDVDKRGRYAALAWKDANERTINELSTGCDGNCPDCDLCDMTADELRQLIAEELEKMAINIVNNVGCGCGCGSNVGGAADDIPDGIPLDTLPPIPPVPGGDLGGDTATADQCAMANYILLEWRNTALAIANGDYSRERYRSWILSVFTEVWNWVVDTAQVFLETMGLFDIVGESGEIASAIDSHYAEMQCKILEGGSQGEIAAKLNASIQDMNLGHFTRYQLMKLIGLMPLTAPTTSGLGDVPGVVGDEYYARGCPSCVTEVLPPTPSGLALRDHTTTEGKLFVDGVRVTTTGIEFDYNRQYILSGDVADHMDCEISAALAQSVPAPTWAEITNLAAAVIQINTRDPEDIINSVTINPNETITVLTSLLDANGNGFTSIQVVFTQWDGT
jgi:hypothetical protein